jgi:aspartyl-tRNA(Asn)/glutamyl-tRNA(Gln) amidotransferase subunit C
MNSRSGSLPSQLQSSRVAFRIEHWKKRLDMEEKHDAAYFKGLAHQLMFDLSDQEADDIVKEFDTLNRQLELLDAVNTDGVEPMVYPFEEETSFLRDDQVSNVITQEEALSNVDKKLEGHFVLPRVVK